jgi:4-amino-4-deoxy-L-arabinose transferase-like glycosyltransferase
MRLNDSEFSKNHSMNIEQKVRVFTSSSRFRSVVNEKTLLLLIGGFTVLVLLIHFIFLTRYPPVFIDEPWYANVAWNWLKTGVNFDSMHAGAREDIVWPFIGNLPWLITFAAFGLGLFQARLVSWIFGIILVLMTFLVGRKSYSTATGVLAALLLALSPPFMQASHYARPDITLSAMGMLSFLLVMVAFDGGRWWAHFLAGLIITLSLDIHQNAILFALGIVVLYIFEYGRKTLRTPGTWVFVLGGLLGLAYYLILLILPSGSAFVNYYRFSLGTSHQLPLLTLDPLELLRSARAEIGRYHFFENSLGFVFIGASFVYLVIRRFRNDNRLLIFTLTVFIGFVLIVGNKHDIYAILLYPYFMLMVSETMVSLIKAKETIRLPKVYTSSLLVLLLFSGGIYLVRTFVSYSNYSYYEITDNIKRHIPEDARVMGLPNWWLGLADYDYRSNLGLTYNHFFKGYSLEEGLETLRPDILILDTGWQGLLVDEGYFSTEGFDIFKMPRKEFYNFLSQRGEKIFEFSNPWHGKFEIYQIHWDDVSSDSSLGW